ncbi:hypothetical protein [Neorhizobium sp. DT-125]|uniref:hypothetical protein n=1 Tax=Neorhizobium sp. DT-125 TaxID=3396163 RepID=UPI003F1A70D1
MADYREAFVGIDVATLKNAIAIAESGWNGESRYGGGVEASDASMRRIIQHIAAKFEQAWGSGADRLIYNRYCMERPGPLYDAYPHVGILIALSGTRQAVAS